MILFSLIFLFFNVTFILIIYNLVKELKHFKKLHRDAVHQKSKLAMSFWEKERELRIIKLDHEELKSLLTLVLQNDYLRVGNKFTLKQDPLGLKSIRTDFIGKEFKIIEVGDDFTHSMECIETNGIFYGKVDDIRCYDFSSCNKKLTHNFK
jgi:hypothetical protein